MYSVLYKNKPEDTRVIDLLSIDEVKGTVFLGLVTIKFYSNGRKVFSIRGKFHGFKPQVILMFIAKQKVFKDEAAASVTIKRFIDDVKEYYLKNEQIFN